MKNERLDAKIRNLLVFGAIKSGASTISEIVAAINGAKKALVAIYENGSGTSLEIERVVDGRTVSKATKELYDAGKIDRKAADGRVTRPAFEYWVK